MGEPVDNDNGLGLPSLDSLIDHDTAGVSDPLPAGNYRLQLEASGGDLGGLDPNWAVDLVGPAQSMVLTGLSNAGTDGTATSLSFGTVDTNATVIDEAPSYASGAQ